MALKKVQKLKDAAAENQKADGNETGVEGATGEATAPKKTSAPGGRKSGRTWVIPRKRAEVIVQLAGNAGKEKLLALVNRINRDGISVNNAANIKYAISQIAKKPEAYKHRGTQQFDRLAYAIAHKESALTDADLLELELVPEDEAGELQYHLVEAEATGGEDTEAGNPPGGVPDQSATPAEQPAE